MGYRYRVPQYSKMPLLLLSLVCASSFNSRSTNEPVLSPLCRLFLLVFCHERKPRTKRGGRGRGRGLVLQKAKRASNFEPNHFHEFIEKFKKNEQEGVKWGPKITAKSKFSCAPNGNNQRFTYGHKLDHENDNIYRVNDDGNRIYASSMFVPVHKSLALRCLRECCSKDGCLENFQTEKLVYLSSKLDNTTKKDHWVRLFQLELQKKYDGILKDFVKGTIPNFVAFQNSVVAREQLIKELQAASYTTNEQVAVFKDMQHKLLDLQLQVAGRSMSKDDMVDQLFRHMRQVLEQIKLSNKIVSCVDDYGILLAAVTGTLRMIGGVPLFVFLF